MGVFSTVGVSCGDRYRRGIPRRGDSAAGHSGARRAARLGQAAARTHCSVLATFGHPHRAPAGGPSGCQSARPGPSGQLCELGEVTTTTIAKAVARVGAEFDRVRRAGTPFPHQSVHPRIHPRSSHRATCAHRRPSRTWSRWRSGSANCRTSVWSAASPDPPERCRRSSGPPIRRASSVTGWPTAPAMISDSAPTTSTDWRTGPTRWPPASVTCALRSTEIAPSIQRLIDAFSSMRSQYGGDKLVRDVDNRCQARRQHQRARQCHGRELHRRQGHVRLGGPGAGGAARQRGLRCQSLLQRHPRSSSSSWSPRVTTEASTRSTTLAGQLQGFGDTTDPQRDGEPSSTAHSRNVSQGGAAPWVWTNPVARRRA